MLSLLFTRRKLLSDPARLGRWGQKQGERFLRRKGLRMLARNFNCNTGELDLVMANPEDRSVVFVEVKTRANENFTTAESCVTADKRRKIVSTAKYFLASYKINNRPTQFDVVTVVLGKKGLPVIRHFEHAFIP